MARVLGTIEEQAGGRVLGTIPEEPQITTPPQKTGLEKTGNILDVFFGGKKVGEALGTEIARGTFGKTIQRAVLGRELSTAEEAQVGRGPSAGQVFGSALQSASLFIPVGKVAGGITAGARALGISKGASALGKIGAGALTGEAFDVASNLQEGKTGTEALRPGTGTGIGATIPAIGVAQRALTRFAKNQAPRVINSLIKPLQKDFAYGKNPGRAVAEEKIIASDFDELATKIRESRQTIGKEIGTLGRKLSTKPIVNIEDSLLPIDEAIKSAASQNNQTLLSRLSNVKKSLTSILTPSIDDAGNLTIQEVGKRKLNELTFSETRDILGQVGDITQFTGNPSDDKVVNSALKQVYGKIKQKSLDVARTLDKTTAQKFEKLTEKYADLSSAEIATKYRDKIVQRSSLVGLSPQVAGIGTGLLTLVATGGAATPAVLAGITGAVLDKLAQAPGFKTRLAAILSTKSPEYIRNIYQQIPNLQKLLPRGGVNLEEINLEE